MEILIHKHQRVLHLVLNRPAKRNALTLAMCSTIVDAVRTGEEDPNTGCILLSANGSVFCAGMDLEETPPEDELIRVHEALFTLGAAALKPIVVAVNGAALAGGLGLAAQGHVVLASPNAVFGLPELRIALWPFIVSRAVEAAIGARRTLQMTLTGATYPSDQALNWGLVHQICPSAELNDQSKSMAREIAKASPAAISAGLRYRRDSEGKSAHETGQIAAIYRANLMASEDFQEGKTAFKEKREPRWLGISPSGS